MNILWQESAEYSAQIFLRLIFIDDVMWFEQIVMYYWILQFFFLFLFDWFKMMKM